METKNKVMTSKQAFSRFGLGYVVFLLCYSTLPIFILGGIKLVFPALANNQNLALIIQYVIMYGLGFPILLLMVRKIPEENTSLIHSNPSKKLSPIKLFQLFTISFAIVIILAVFSHIINNLIGLIVKGYNAQALAESMSNYSPWALFICAGIIAPIMEEILFRWIPYKKLGHYNQASYILFTSVSFGLIHLNLGQFFYAFVLGLLFSSIVSYTKNIKYTMLLHFLVNFSGSAGLGMIAQYAANNNRVIVSLYGLFIIAVVLTGIVFTIVLTIHHGQFVKQKIKEFWQGIRIGRSDWLNGGTITFYSISLLFIILVIFSLAQAN